MTTFDGLMDSLKNAKTASDTAETLFKEKETEWLEVKAAWQEFKGPTKTQSILNMLAPMAAKMGWKLPGGMGLGALLTGFAADEGGFSSFLSNIPILGTIFEKIGGIF